MKILITDTETSGLPPRNSYWETDFESFPYVVELAWQVYSTAGDTYDLPVLDYESSHIIRPDGYLIPEEASNVHGITNSMANEKGLYGKDVFRHFITDISRCDKIVGHNIHFDTAIIKSHLLRLGIGADVFNGPMDKEKRVDTMKPSGTNYVVSKGLSGKWPKLCDIYRVMFNREMEGAHGALCDVKATKEVFFELIRLGFIK